MVVRHYRISRWDAACMVAGTHVIGDTEALACEASSKGLGNVVALTPCPAADVKRTSSSLASPVLISPVVLSCQEVRYVKE